MVREGRRVNDEGLNFNSAEKNIAENLVRNSKSNQPNLGYNLLANKPRPKLSLTSKPNYFQQNSGMALSARPLTTIIISTSASMIIKFM
jgi:hypothetical protein